MRAKKFFGIKVLDKNVREVGKVEDVEIDTEACNVNSIIISLNKGIFSSDEIEVEFDKIATIGDYILLNSVIETEVEETEAEPKPESVTIEVEDDK